MYQLTDTSSIIRLSDGAHIPADPANTDYAAYLAWLAEGNEPLPVPGPTPEQIQAAVTAAVQERLDAFARTRGYDGILSLCSYATSRNPKFQAEGQHGVDLRDATWDRMYVVLAEVQAGLRPMPAGYADIEGELPPMRWHDEPEPVPEPAPADPEPTATTEPDPAPTEPSETTEPAPVDPAPTETSTDAPAPSETPTDPIPAPGS